MNIVVKLPDKDYSVILSKIMLACYGCEIVELPKGHGRLIDADEAIKTLESLGNRDYRREKGTIREAEKMLRYDEYTPTIIEADKAEQEEATR